MFESCLFFKDDVRTVAAFRQTMIQRSIMQRGGELTNAHDIEKAAYVDTMQRVFMEWFETHDALLASRGSPLLDWPRRSHVRQLHVSCCRSSATPEHISDRVVFFSFFFFFDFKGFVLFLGLYSVPVQAA